MAFEQLGQTVPVEERELGWDDTIEKEFDKSVLILI